MQQDLPHPDNRQDFYTGTIGRIDKRINVFEPGLLGQEPETDPFLEILQEMEESETPVQDEQVEEDSFFSLLRDREREENKKSEE